MGIYTAYCENSVSGFSHINDSVAIYSNIFCVFLLLANVCRMEVEGLQY